MAGGGLSPVYMTSTGIDYWSATWTPVVRAAARFEQPLRAARLLHDNSDVFSRHTRMHAFL